VPGRHVKIDTNRDSHTNWAPTCLCHVEVDVRGRFGSNRWLLRADVEYGDAVGARGLSRPGDVLVGMTDAWGTVASSRILPRRAGWGLREPGVSTVVRRPETAMEAAWTPAGAGVAVMPMLWLVLLSLWVTDLAPIWSWTRVADCTDCGQRLERLLVSSGTWTSVEEMGSPDTCRKRAPRWAPYVTTGPRRAHLGIGESPDHRRNA
jgi:hypothetical protein